MSETNTKELMDHIITNFNWWKGYCNHATSRTILHRHKNGILSDETYEKVFIFHGYKKIVTWVRIGIDSDNIHQ